MQRTDFLASPCAVLAVVTMTNESAKKNKVCVHLTILCINAQSKTMGMNTILLITLISSILLERLDFWGVAVRACVHLCHKSASQVRN